MIKVTKELIYTVDIDTPEGEEFAKEIKATLKESYDIVDTCPNGGHQVRIIAKLPNT